MRSCRSPVLPEQKPRALAGTTPERQVSRGLPGSPGNTQLGTRSSNENFRDWSACEAIRHPPAPALLLAQKSPEGRRHIDIFLAMACVLLRNRSGDPSRSRHCFRLPFAIRFREDASKTNQNGRAPRRVMLRDAS